MARDNRPKARREGRGASKARPGSPRPCPEARPGWEPAWPLGCRVPPGPVPQKHALGAHHPGGAPGNPRPCPEARPRTHPGREPAWPLGYRVPPGPPLRARSTGPPRQGGHSTWRSGGQEQPVRSPWRQAGHSLTPREHPPVPVPVPGGRSVPHPQEGLARARRNRRRGACRTPPAPRKASAAPGHAQEAWLSWVGQPLAVQPPSRVRLCWAMVGDFRPGPAQNSCSWPRKWPTSWLMT